MRRRAVLRTVVPVVAAVVAALGTGTGTGAASVPAGQAAPAAHIGPGLLLTVAGPGSGGHRSVTLLCDPPGGTHPEPVAACDALALAGGDPNALAGEPGICPLDYNPVTASAYGDFRGRVVSWRKTFTNACVLHRETTPVFDF
ncbi:SSI family serine proteinase inhibitor [Streptomyces yaizuensis]|uniref:Peptidase n=1 Tax=Streptomyces yaizuensis TaxID=2989713 RepID=A0ABQ5P007_9ACTN|nr:SSI family serine proteinase inhibitor [Streptomyces sp. YSPA8]GLF95941.1 peptidase [Streptomyces sp. YSPA8]